LIVYQQLLGAPARVGPDESGFRKAQDYPRGVGTSLRSGFAQDFWEEKCVDGSSAYGYCRFNVLAGELSPSTHSAALRAGLICSGFKKVKTRGVSI